MLQAAELPLPEKVWAHGFVLLGGEKFSKSAGVKLDLHEAIDRYGPDAFRYYLLREVPFDADGSFSWERFEQVYTSELANTWGNLVSRAIAMVEKYCHSTVPAAMETEVDRADAIDVLAYHAAMDGSRGFLLHEALRRAMASVTRGNEYVQTMQPWFLAKSPDTRTALETTLGTLQRSLARQAVMLYPFVPTKAQELWQQLGAPGRIEDQRITTLMKIDATGWRVRKGPPMFPKPATAP
jgi:methionyl-tRNA synthetase